MAYSITDYERPSVAVDIAVFGVTTEQHENARVLDYKKLQVLFIRRGEEPFKGSYALPGGFLRKGETISEAAVRELSEETGVKMNTDKIISLGTYSAADRDPRGWIISCAHIALLNSTDIVTAAGTDACDACWFDFEYKEHTGADNSHIETVILSRNADFRIVLDYADGKLQRSSEEIAFDHAQILYDAFRRLREDVIYRDTAFELLPELFTVSDLQQIYEAITCKKEASANFRRKMQNKIAETDMFEEAARHRTAKLYRRRED